jgi:hypothetical protein
MLTPSSTRLVAFAASEPAFAEPCVESALPTSTGPSSSMIRRPGDSQIVQRVLGSTAFQVRSAVLAPGRVHSIPIHPPR